MPLEMHQKVSGFQGKLDQLWPAQDQESPKDLKKGASNVQLEVSCEQLRLVSPSRLALESAGGTTCRTSKSQDPG